MPPLGRAIAVAPANIALAKYWGKVPDSDNHPAVPSLSLTLDALTTRTEVAFDQALTEDQVLLNELPLSGPGRERVTAVLDRLRAEARVTTRARVVSRNSFPTAAGLASSASGFAALVMASAAALDLGLDRPALSARARQASASAARSVFDGWVTLPLGADAAQPLAPPDHWDVALLVVIAENQPKSIGSSSAMNLTRATSPYYPAWVETAPRLYQRACTAVKGRDLDALGPVLEQSALMMHATMLAADPSIVYFTPATLSLLATVRELRRCGVRAYATMDAGPQVKVLCESPDAPRVEQALADTPGAQRIIRCRPGKGAYLLEPAPGAP